MHEDNGLWKIEMLFFILCLALTRILWKLSAPRYSSFASQGGTRDRTTEGDLEFMKRESSLGTMTWDTAESSTFLIRGKHYLRDHKKVTTKSLFL